LDCGGIVQTEWYLFVRVSILTFSKIFPLDGGVNVQTVWYLFVMIFILTFSTIFLLDCGGIVQTEWYLFVRVSIKHHSVCTIPPQSNRKIVEKVKIDTLANKYHPV
jgi:hypothetical protein